MTRIAQLPALLLAIALAGCAAGRGSGGAPAGAARADSAAILRDVAYLASDALEGRATGSPGNDSAAAYIARRLGALGLQANLQRFTARSAAAAHSGLPGELPTQNVVAIIPGSDRALRGESVVLGAHYDHLGRWTFGALDLDAGAVIHNGADDNASGTAAVLELARLLARRPPKRSVVVALFSGEELGLLGSQYLVEHFPVPLDSVVAMLNFDMVGRMRDRKLVVYGTATATELPAMLDSANLRAARAAGREPLVLTATGDGFGSSDHSSFYAKNLPVLHFFTNTHDDYHRASDDVERIDAGGAARVVEVAERVVREIGDQPGRLTFSRTPAPAMGSMSAGGGAYFGSVPDMAAGEVKGMRISGVTPGSPADRAGLKAGDVIVRFGGAEVTELYSYTDALRSKKPGDEVQVIVLRNGERVTLTATLGRRGGG